jgi:hypothetical protein
MAGDWTRVTQLQPCLRLCDPGCRRWRGSDAVCGVDHLRYIASVDVVLGHHVAIASQGARGGKVMYDQEGGG